eukprot:COSAG02_NODE_1440_length_12590_cov_2.822352_7_plen_53_part_00
MLMTPGIRALCPVSRLVGGPRRRGWGAVLARVARLPLAWWLVGGKRPSQALS